MYRTIRLLLKKNPEYKDILSNLLVTSWALLQLHSTSVNPPKKTSDLSSNKSKHIKSMGISLCTFNNYRDVY